MSRDWKHLGSALLVLSCSDSARLFGFEEHENDNPVSGTPQAGGATGSDGVAAPNAEFPNGEAPPSSAASPELTPGPGNVIQPAPHWVFDDTALRTYSLSLPAELWAQLKATARDEIYVPADLEVEGERLPQVGLRFKGGFGSLYACFDETGTQVCSKLGMKIKFDEFVPDQRLHGLKRLNFNSMRLDPSHMHERLGYRLFREMGMAAPRAAHARLVVNGEYLGVFALVEQVDGRFTDAHFEGGDNDGNLYEEQWPKTDDLATLTEHLETNEEAPDHSVMLAFHAALRDAGPDERAAVVEQFTHTDQLFDYLAVDRTINNWDGVTGFYCSDTACDNYNYYLYQHEQEPRFTLIPWDLDQSFAPSSHFDAVPGALEIPDDCSVRHEVSPGVFVLPPGCDPIFEGLARSDRARFRAALARLLEGPFTLELMNGWLETWQAQLEPAVAEDINGPGLEAFRAAVARLRDDLGLLRERALVERDGMPIERFALAPGSLTDFEATSPLALGLGLARATTPETRLSVALGATGALSGARDLRFRFEFHDGASAWSQWAQVKMPLAAAAALGASSRLRLLIRSDRARDLRISFDSPAYSDRAASGEVGWDIQLDGTPQQLDLTLATASFPAWGLPVQETPAAVLAQVTALLFEPAANGRGEDGMLGAGVADSGEIQIDDIQLVP